MFGIIRVFNKHKCKVAESQSSFDQVIVSTLSVTAPQASNLRLGRVQSKANIVCFDEKRVLQFDRSQQGRDADLRRTGEELSSIAWHRPNLPAHVGLVSVFEPSMHQQ